MNRKFKTIMAAVVLLLGVACLCSGCCKKQPKVTVTPTNLTLDKDEIKEVSINFEKVCFFTVSLKNLQKSSAMQ